MCMNYNCNILYEVRTWNDHQTSVFLGESLQALALSHITQNFLFVCLFLSADEDLFFLMLFEVNFKFAVVGNLIHRIFDGFVLSRFYFIFFLGRCTIIKTRINSDKFYIPCYTGGHVSNCSDLIWDLLVIRETWKISDGECYLLPKITKT